MIGKDSANIAVRFVESEKHSLFFIMITSVFSKKNAYTNVYAFLCIYILHQHYCPGETLVLCCEAHSLHASRLKYAEAYLLKWVPLFVSPGQCPVLPIL